MRKLNLTILVFVMSLLAPVGGYSQFFSPNIPPSPEAAKLGLYTTIPVNYYSGIPETKIDMGEIKIKNLTVPVNLSYYSGGIRQDEEAGCVGLGWSLNAGGVITRTKRHKDDFGDKGYFKNANSTSCGDDIDLEPDLFFFNFCGKQAGLF